MMYAATYYRRLIRLCLLSFIVYYFIIKLLTIAPTNLLSLLKLQSNSSTTSTTSTTKITTRLKKTPTKRHTCTPYSVSDTRPFFEREPPQPNLPRRISNTTDHDLLHRLRSLRLVLCGCARNVGNKLENFRKYAEPIIDLFHPISRILIFESDSADNTLAKLHQWHRAEVYSYEYLSKTIPEREKRLAYCRNVLLEKARQLQSDYMLLVDVDIFSANISSFLSNFDYDTNDWSVMTANLIRHYYDTWALRTLSDTILNYDVQHQIRALTSINNYCYHSVQKYVEAIHAVPYPPNRKLLEVRSAFDGAGLYKMEAVKGCSYSAENRTCEHVPFHLCIREKNHARIFINPKFTNEKF